MMRTDSMWFTQTKGRTKQKSERNWCSRNPIHLGCCTVDELYHLFSAGNRWWFLADACSANMIKSYSEKSADCKNLLNIKVQDFIYLYWTPRWIQASWEMGFLWCFLGLSQVAMCLVQPRREAQRGRPHQLHSLSCCQIVGEVALH